MWRHNACSSILETREKLTTWSESVLPVTQKEGKGEGNMAIGPRMKYGRARHYEVTRQCFCRGAKHKKAESYSWVLKGYTKPDCFTKKEKGICQNLFFLATKWLSFELAQQILKSCVCNFTTIWKWVNKIDYRKRVLWPTTENLCARSDCQTRRNFWSRLTPIFLFRLPEPVARPPRLDMRLPQPQARPSTPVYHQVKLCCELTLTHYVKVQRLTCILLDPHLCYRNMRQVR